MLSGKGSTFVRILYFVFTFFIGIIIALIILNQNMYLISYDIMYDALDSGDYSSAMELIGGYYNKEDVYHDNDEQGGIVLFQAITLVYNSNEEGDETIDESKVCKSYAGFLFNVKDYYDTESEIDNKTCLRVYDSENNQYDIDILDYDINEDGYYDAIGSLKSKNLIYFEINQTVTNSISKLSFIDKSGNIFKEINFNFDFECDFFNDANDFVDEYNRDYKSERLQELNDEFLAKSENYKISSVSNARKKSFNKAIWFLVIYFICCYAALPLMFTLLNKYLKGIKKNNKQSNVKFGNDYYSKVTISLDISEVSEIDEVINIKYSKNNDFEEFNFSKGNNYSCTKRVKAGVYMNPWIEISNKYKAVDMPENLDVQGFQMNITIKIVREGEE